MPADKTKVVIVLVVLFILSSSIGAVIWGATTNWWGLTEETPAPKSPSGGGGSPSPTPGGGGPASNTGRGISVNREFRIKLKNFNLYFEMSTNTNNQSALSIKPLNSSSNYQKWTMNSNGYIQNKGTQLFLTWDGDNNGNDIINGWRDYFNGGNGRQIWSYNSETMYLSTQNHNLGWSNWNADTGFAESVVYTQPGNGRHEILIEYL